MLYGEDDIAVARKSLKRQMLIVYAFIAVGAGVSAAGLALRIRPLAVAGITLFCMAAYFWYDMKASVWRKYLRFLIDVKTGRAHVSEGVIDEVAESVRRSEEGVAIRDVSLKDTSGEETLFYWDDAKPLPQLAGKNVRVTAYGRYITGVEMI